jgi:hypothetical protein
MAHHGSIPLHKKEFWKCNSSIIKYICWIKGETLFHHNDLQYFITRNVKIDFHYQIYYQMKHLSFFILVIYYYNHCMTIFNIKMLKSKKKSFLKVIYLITSLLK